jgi:outer membrane lipoprotein-sorting protein
MKKRILTASLAALLAASAFGESRQGTPDDSSILFRSLSCLFFRPGQFYLQLQRASFQSAPARGNTTASGNLEQVLSLLDRVSAGFKTVQTDFEWDQYQKVVDEHDIQKGVMYFKRSGANVDVAADIKSPVGKKILLKGGDLQIFVRKTGQVTHYDPGKNRQDFESFLALGFGGKGHDLTKNFDIRYVGTENIGGESTYKIELTPKTQKVRGMVGLITLWINQKTGMSVQQRLDQGEGDYRLAKYTNIDVNHPQKMPDDAFKLKGK